MAYLPKRERVLLYAQFFSGFTPLFFSVRRESGDSFHTQHFQLLCISARYAVAVCRFGAQQLLPEIGITTIAAVVAAS